MNLPKLLAAIAFELEQSGGDPKLALRQIQDKAIRQAIERRYQEQKEQAHKLASM